MNMDMPLQMTAYPGGKQRVGLDIARAIRKVYDQAKKRGFKLKGYCEPFVGMCGVYQHVPELFKDVRGMKYLAGDLNKSLILMWKAAQRGAYPSASKVTKERYMQLRDSGDSRSTAEKGFVGHMFGFRSIYFQGFKPSVTRNTIIHSIQQLKHISKKLVSVSFKAGKYDQFSGLKGFIIYCDPPYKNTHQNYCDENRIWRDRFDTDRFVEWCQKMARHNVVLISEYDKPSCACKCIYRRSNEKLYIVQQKRSRQ